MWKMRNKFLVYLMLTLFVMLGGRCLASAQPFEKVPEKLQAALFIKVLAMSKEISGGDDISIHVVGSPAAAAEFRKAIGRKIGKSKLAEVSESDGIPLDRPVALYIGDKAQSEELIQYCRANQVLSMTGIPDLVPQGVTLGAGTSEDKLKVLLNGIASVEEKITWNPTLYKISKLYK
ncbi:MAG: hypothetical protein B6245_23970 [Desulfobacteraceae bacterium 4572_88]|nr:MAG: hypothetical protein B6245_23970 [Desulfobacteraceae bacterium 4572_88]